MLSGVGWCACGACPRKAGTVTICPCLGSSLHLIFLIQKLDEQIMSWCRSVYFSSSRHMGSKWCATNTTPWPPVTVVTKLWTPFWYHPGLMVCCASHCDESFRIPEDALSHEINVTACELSVNRWNTVASVTLHNIIYGSCRLYLPKIWWKEVMKISYFPYDKKSG
jgi:hypothetical protein